MRRILCVIDGMTDPHFQVERYGHLASMGSMRYVDTCGGFPPETLHCVLRLLGVTDLPVHLRGYVEALGAGIPVRPDDLLLAMWIRIWTPRQRQPCERRNAAPLCCCISTGRMKRPIATIRRKRRLSCAGSMIGCSPGCWRLSMRLWWPPTTELIQKAEPIWVAHSLFLPAVKW